MAAPSSMPVGSGTGLPSFRQVTQPAPALTQPEMTPVAVAPVPFVADLLDPAQPPGSALRLVTHRRLAVLPAGTSPRVPACVPRLRPGQREHREWHRAPCRVDRKSAV